MGRVVDYESTLERDFYLLQEFRREISGFVEQPMTITFEQDGKCRRHTPDAVLEYTRPDRSLRRFELVDIKYRSDIRDHWDEYRPQFKAALAYARARNWKYAIWTEVEIRTAELANAKLLLPLRKEPPPVAGARICAAAVEPRGAKICDLIRLQADQELAVQLRGVLVLLARGDLRANQQCRLTMESIVYAAP